MSKIRAFLAQNKLRWYLLLLGLVLTLPALFHGFEVDDRLQRTGATGKGTLYFLGRTPTDLYTFVDGNPDNTQQLIDLGIATWWTDINAKISFFRPITSLLLWTDHHLLKVPFLLHLHSALWYLGCIAAAFALYRRFIAEKWIAGLASFMFAVDHTHGLPAAWIAQRNTLTTGLFGLLTLYFHDRARRDQGRTREAFFAAICLGLALFSAEAALCILPYLIVHAWTFDRHRFLRALLPFAPPFLLWFVAYKVGGFGSHGSGLYVDPADSPLAYLDNVLHHWPILAATEFGLPGGDFYAFLPPSAKAVLIAIALSVVVLFVFAMRPLLRENPTTRFLLLSGLLALIPPCATIPAGRLTFLASFGLLGVLAQFVAGWLERADWFPKRGISRILSFPIVFWTGFGHILLSPFFFVFSLHQMTIFESVLNRLTAGLPNDEQITQQRAVIVNAPEPVFAAYIMVIRQDSGGASPAKMLSMTNGARACEMKRTGPSTVVLSSSIGLVQPMTDLLTRANEPFTPGYKVELSDVNIEVTKLNAEGWPLEAQFTFHHPLEHEGYRFMQWKNQTLAPLDLPQIGETISFPAQVIQMF